MKILLDENIMPKSKIILEQYGHDVIHVLDRFCAGKTDNQVFQLAVNEKRALVTLNGKDFIVFIPPLTNIEKHYGLVWLRGFQVTNKTYIKIMEVIGDFLKNKGDIIENTYYAVRKKADSYEVIQRYPQLPAFIFNFDINNE